MAGFDACCAEHADTIDAARKVRVILVDHGNIELRHVGMHRDR
jgi:hypothetical protein